MSLPLLGCGRSSPASPPSLAENEVIRPAGNVNTLWGVYNYTAIDEEVLHGNPGNGTNGDRVVAVDADDLEEQGWGLSTPLGNGQVTTARLWVRGYAIPITANRPTARLRVGGSFTDPQTLLLRLSNSDGYPGPEDNNWTSLDFSGIWDASDTFEIFLTAAVLGKFDIYRIDVIYLELNP